VTAMTDHLIPNLVYSLCGLMSVACALLMVRAWRRNRQRLLLFVGLAFVGLALNNVLLVTDLLIMTSVDLSTVRAAVGLGAVAGLLFAFIWEAK
jgi:hypothetical protein